VAACVAALALVIGLAVAFAPPANHGTVASRHSAVPSATPTHSGYTADEQSFISDARSQFNVGAEVGDGQLVSVGHQVCDGVQSGKDRAALDKVPGDNGLGFSGGGGGADALVNLALKDMCGGLEPKATWHTLAHYSGSGQWNSPPFKLVGDNPEVKVTYSYSGNGDSFGADNFIADMVSSGDDVSIANDIAYSGGKTTRLYPDVSFGGSRRYHLEIQASGNWTFTVKEKY
jgi:hypothetical protein